MKRLLILFLISFSISAQEDLKISFDDRIYDPFFSATVRDNEGEKFLISRVAFFDEFNDKNFFFWVRRNSGLYNLSFKNIKSLTFEPDDFSDTRYRNFTRCTLELVTGESYLIYLKTSGHLEGWDETFGSPVSFYLHYNLITSIEFHHNGEYWLCPFCKTIYFDQETDSCIYDKTPLIKGVLSPSDK